MRKYRRESAGDRGEGIPFGRGDSRRAEIGLKLFVLEEIDKIV